MKSERRYDIDWLRVIAIGLLLIYHVAIGFQPWGVFIRFIQSEESIVSIWTFMALINVWRIPLLFFVSGMGVYFAMKKRNLKEILLERTKRILIPLLFGVLFIVPIHVYLWQKYYAQDLSYTLSQGHLWFLANIFVYVSIFLPPVIIFKNIFKSRVLLLLKSLYGNPIGLMSVSILFVLEALVVDPDIYTLYATTFHGFTLGFLCFVLGFTFVATGNIFWQTVLKWRWLFLTFAVVFYFLRLLVFRLEAPNYLVSIESIVWIYSIFGFGMKYLNRPSNILNYLSRGVYPIYITHMIFLYLASYIIFPLDISTPLKFLLSVVFTITFSWLSYELVIRRIKFLKPLFGLK